MPGVGLTTTGTHSEGSDRIVDNNRDRQTKKREESFVPNTALHEAAKDLIKTQRKAILLVEDTAAHAALVRRAFNSKVWEIEHATRGSDALRFFEADSDRIVLLDLTLPDSDGLQVLTQILSINPDAPVVVVTAMDQVSVSVEAMRRGACDYVVKSDPKESTKQILSAVERAWQMRLRNAENSLMEKTKLVELLRAQRLEAIEEVVRTVCFQVNNPLSGVVALSQLLQRHKNSDSELKRLADGIARSASQVAGVVQKLREIGDGELDFAAESRASIQEEEEAEEKDSTAPLLRTDENYEGEHKLGQ